MSFLYHGSHIKGITRLNACSMLHNSDQRALYLTDNIPYALLYIWDEIHNHSTEKHVTGWVKNGTAHYEEQFHNQLEVFYKGVSGCLYCVEKSQDIKAFEGRECIYYSSEGMAVENVIYVSDIYEELIRYEKTGEFTVRRFNEQSPERQQELTEMMSQVIIKSDFCRDAPDKAGFYLRYFHEAWKKAEVKANQT